MSVTPDKGGEDLEAAWEPCPGSGSAVLGCTGLPPVAVGSTPAAFSVWVSPASRCCSYRPSGDSSCQVLIAGPRAFEAAQVDE